MMKKERGWLLDIGVIGLLCSMVVAITWRIGLAGRVLAGGDVFTYFYPYWAAATRAIRALRIPGWNADLFMGVPLAANSQVGFFYPLNWPLWILLPAHRSVHVSIVVHLCIAAACAVVWGRRGLRLGRLASGAVGAIFALSGYLIAQMEHVNQLQGLAWFPLLLTLTHALVQPQREHSERRAPESAGGLGPTLRSVNLRATAALALVIALILLAGHTQTAFISLVGTAVYASAPGLWVLIRRRRVQLLGVTILGLVLAATLGVCLAAVQLLPTWQLTRLSLRAEGLPFNERVSFSLSPLYLGQALLPSFGQRVPPEHLEHVAYAGAVGLVLAFSALVTNVRQDAKRRPLETRRCLGPYLLALVGLFLALGLYNPLYILLARYVPGFAHFRVPARWLVLYVLGMAGMAGRAVDGLWERERPGIGRVLMALALVVLLMVFAVVGAQLEGDWRGNWATLLGWAGALVGCSVLLWVGRSRPRISAIGLTILMLVELFLAGEALPHARATAPQAFTSLRPAIAHLLTAQTRGSEPMNRFLSLSDTTFDPGDLSLIREIYGLQLSNAQLYEFVVATKQKEVLSPNLSLAFGLPALDGYGGGLLPLQRYVMLQHAFLSPGEVSMDGRLRENLLEVPDGRWLSFLNVGHVITDKLQDAWVDDVFYDLQFGARLAESESVAVPEIPPFEATALGIVSHLEGLGDAMEAAPIGLIRIGFSNGTVRSFDLRAGADVPVRAGEAVTAEATRIRWAEASRPLSITVESLTTEGEWVVRGVTLIDERTGSFQPLVLSDRGRFRLDHSGDVKIYENLDVLPRAFVASRALQVAGDEAALNVLRDPTLDLSSEIVFSSADSSCAVPALTPATGEDGGSATITAYSDDRVVVEATLRRPGYLVLTDAYHPGWQATVDGEPRPICRADILFRAIALEPGAHRLILTFRPTVQRLGVVVSLLAIFVIGIVAYKGRLSKA